MGEGEEEWRPPFDYQPCIEDEEMTEEERADIECTLMIIKPEALVYREEIERRVREEGFQIFQTRWLQLTPEQVSEFYSDKYGQLNFAYLVAYMASGPIVVHVLGKKNAIHEWKLLMGPTKVILNGDERTIVETKLQFVQRLQIGFRWGRRVCIIPIV